MKKTIIISWFISFFFHSSCAQGPLIKQWDQRFGGSGNEELSSFQETRDGGFILGGWSYSGVGGDKTQPSRGGSDYWIVKTDQQGVKLWDKRFGGPGNDELHALQQTSDGGYILGGYSRSGTGGDKTQANWDTSAVANPTSDYWIVKTDSLGNMQWDRRFGGIYEDELYAIQQTSDGGFILGGVSYSTSGGDRTQPTRGSADYWIVKTDSLGNKQWDMRYGGTNNDQLYSVRQTTDGGYILGGYSWSQVSGDKTQPNCGSTNNCDFWVVKTDAYGNVEWDKRYGGSENDEVYSVLQTSDHGYILAGYSWSGISGDKTQNNFGPLNTSDYWIVKTDSLGNKLWDRDFGGVIREDEFGNVFQSTDKGYLIAGTSYSDASGNKSENNLGVEQSWVIKTDSTGNKLWDKTILTAGHDESGYAIQTKDGSYAIANHTNSGIGGYKTQPNRDSSNMTYDYLVAKFRDTTLTPLVSYTASNNAVCAYTCIEFTNTTLYGDSYQWVFDGASPSVSTDANPHNICYDLPGNYDVTLISTNNLGHDTLTLHHFITVFPIPPSFSIMRTGDTLFAPSGYAHCQWFRYSTPILNATNHFYIPMHGGNYSVFVVDSNGCSINAAIFVENAGVDEIAVAGLEVFPNPASEELNFSFRNISCPCKLSITNVIGQEVYTSILAEGEKQPYTVTQKFKPGVYTAIMSGKSSFSTSRLVVQ